MASQRTVTLRPSDPEVGEVVAAAGLTPRFDAMYGGSGMVPARSSRTSTGSSPSNIKVSEPSA